MVKSVKQRKLLRGLTPTTMKSYV